MVFKFLGKGKKSEFFLEAPPVANGTEAVTKVIDKVAEVADKVTDTVTDKVAEVAEKVTDKANKTESTEPAKPEVVANGASATSTKEAAPKAKKFKKVKASETKESAPAAVAKPATPAAAKPVAQPEPVVKNFATDFLMPSNTPRRRPGPSLDAFRNMAKDVKPRK